MSESRKKTVSFCLKNGATSTKVELFDASLWEDGRHGTVRLRINGRWHDMPDGGRCYMDSAGVGRVMVELLAHGAISPAPPAPQLKKGQVVSVPCGPEFYGIPCSTTQGRVCSDRVVLGYDNRYYAVVFAPHIGTTLYPVDDLGGC